MAANLTSHIHRCRLVLTSSPTLTITWQIGKVCACGLGCSSLATAIPIYQIVFQDLSEEAARELYKGALEAGQAQEQPPAPEDHLTSAMQEQEQKLRVGPVLPMPTLQLPT